jgi:lipoate-protein ligase A
MIRNPSLRIYKSLSTDPFFNLAFERKLFEAYKLKPTKGSQLPDHTLYLWCNAPSVVIGRYQNAHKECRLNAIEHDNVNFIRRKSGGGAVYQDLGNSLYTMISKLNTEFSDSVRNRNNKILLNALSSLFVSAQIAGRNDIHCYNKKISGNAYRLDENVFLHHGTMLLNVEIGALLKYLTPNKAKLESKGVKSIVSRVTNLSNYIPVTREIWDNALVKAFLKEHNHFTIPIELIDHDTLYNDPEIKEYIRESKSQEWLYDNEPHFTNRFEHRFEWGSVDILLQVEKNIITNCKIYSDTLYFNFIEIIEKEFCNVSYEKNPINKLFSYIRDICHDAKISSEYSDDILKLILEKM